MLELVDYVDQIATRFMSFTQHASCKQSGLETAESESFDQDVSMYALE